ncbi:MAG: hypothetical protein R3C97_04345 [Geminicoccaceae bacterium]
MISDAKQAEVLGERLRDVGFSDRAVGLIIEQVQGLGRDVGDYNDLAEDGHASALAESAAAYEVDRGAEVDGSKDESGGGAAPGPITRRVGKPPKRAASRPEESEGKLIAPDLPLFGAGLLAWIMVLAGSWRALSCSPSLLGVGEVEIVGSGCSAAAPGLVSFTGLVTVLWLFAPAAWHPLRGFLRLPRLEIEPALRATAIWCGFALLLVTTLLLASMA